MVLFGRAESSRFVGRNKQRLEREHLLTLTADNQFHSKANYIYYFIIRSRTNHSMADLTPSPPLYYSFLGFYFHFIQASKPYIHLASSTTTPLLSLSFFVPLLVVLINLGRSCYILIPPHHYSITPPNFTPSACSPIRPPYMTSPNNPLASSPYPIIL